MNGKDRVGRQGLHAIKARLHNSAQRGEERREARKIAQGSGKMRRVSRSYLARRFGSATHWQHVQKFEEFQGEAFWFGGVAGGTVTVTCQEWFKVIFTRACKTMVVTWSGSLARMKSISRYDSQLGLLENNYLECCLFPFISVFFTGVSSVFAGPSL